MTNPLSDTKRFINDRIFESRGNNSWVSNTSLVNNVVWFLINREICGVITELIVDMNKEH